MSKNIINYSTCWEDPAVLREALDIQSDDRIISITSGGDNSLALLLAQPKEVISVDFNFAQNYLLELKRAAVLALEYDEFLEFLGVRESTDRLQSFDKVAPFLSPSIRQWWLEHSEFIKRGAIHCGRFELFSARFAHYVLPFIHSQKRVSQLLSVKTIQEQTTFYREKWDSRLWRFFFGLASSRFVLKKYARQPGMFAYSAKKDIGIMYRQRLERLLCSVGTHGNFFLQYSLTGNYINALPPYLERDGYQGLRDTQALSVISESLLTYLKSASQSSFSKFNLSDIFEALSPEENDSLWQEIVRTAKSGARVAYWTNLLPRSHPSSLTAHIREEKAIAERLHRKDRVFFYDTFHLYTILK